MTNQQHPITPPPELVQQWNENAVGTHFPPYGYSKFIAARAAQWGADQELEACREWLTDQETQSAKWFDIRHDACALASDLRAARRPRPPSLKEQALTAMLHLQEAAETNMDTIEAVHIICRALEALPNG